MTGRRIQGDRRDDGITPPAGSAEAGHQTGQGSRPRWAKWAGPRSGLMSRSALMPRTASGPPRQRPGGPRFGVHRGQDPGGKAFAAVTILPTMLLISWLMAGLPLLATGRFMPVPMVLISVPVAVVLVLMTSRHLPGRWPAPASWARPGRPAGGEPAGVPAADETGWPAEAEEAGPPADGEEAGPPADGEEAGPPADGEEAGPPAEDEGAGRAAGGATGRAAGGRAWHAWWGLAGTVTVAVVFAMWQFRENSPQFIVIRDPGAFLQLGYWIAEHGSLPIPPSLAAFGGSHPGITLSSFGFVGHAGAVAPRLAPGLPMLLAAGLWAHSLPGGAAVSPLLGAFAVLTVGGLTGRLAGPHWAPAGAFLVALTLPEMYTSRSAFPEIFAQVLLFGGLCLVVDSLGPRQSRLLAALGGFALGLTVLVRVGSLGDLLPAIVFVGALLAARRPQGFALYGGLLAGAGCALVGDFLLAGPLMSALSRQLGLAGLVAAVFVVVTLAGAAVGLADPIRRHAVRWLAVGPLRWLPEAGAAIVIAAALGLLIRPYLQTVRDGASAYIAALQRLSGLPVDPRRVYAEDSLYWVIWYLGAPALLLGVAGLALLTRRCLRALITWRDPTGMARAWALPLLVIGWGVITVLWRPETVPDQPWASRRLVPVLLPGLIVAAIWVAAWLAVRAREHGAGLVAVSSAAACFVAALVVPSAVTTLGIGTIPATPAGGGTATTGLAFQRTGAGELGAIAELCVQLPGDSSVVILDSTAASEFSQVIRSMCGIPAAVAVGATHGQVEAVTGGITQAGREPVLLATNPAELTPFGTRPRKVVDLTTTQDAHLLTQPPASTWPVRYVLWMSGTGAGGGLPGGA
jgi:hypothetical protein